MKYSNLTTRMALPRRIGLALSLAVMVSVSSRAAETGRTFATPEAAVTALIERREDNQ